MREAPPTAEVNAVARLCESETASVLCVLNTGYECAVVATEIDGTVFGVDLGSRVTIRAAQRFLMLGPDGPLSWDDVARLVDTTGDQRRR